jgi:V/A-type H+-transporting ATPase subunit D
VAEVTVAAATTRQLSATRSELLARRSQIALANLGLDLLKEKRDALRSEFIRLSGSLLEAMGSLDERCGEGRRELSNAVALDGPEMVGSAAFAAIAEVEVGLSARNVAGVSIVEVDKPALRRPATDRGYSLRATTARVDGVAEAFESQLDLLLDVVARELSLRRLAEAITLTTRRMNALEVVVIPRLEAERDSIELMLDEREREDRVRLMRARQTSAMERGA